MKTNIMQWGNSLAIRIPKSFAQEMEVVSGMEVDIKVKGSSLLIEKRNYSAKDLIHRISPENLHGETDTGIYVGNEIW